MSNNLVKPEEISTVKPWNEKIKYSWDTFFLFLIVIGIVARFLAMTMGHNYDFNSFEIVGNLVRTGKNVYANTSRYNYGFLFFLIQGFGYSLSVHFPEAIEMYRVYIVSVLTIADLGITLWIAKNYSKKAALFFFLNPVSVVITGYHNQFDNIAVFLALLSTEFITDEKKLNRNDLPALFFLSLSLITKHILYAFFLWLLMYSKPMTLLKRLVYSSVPPIAFLLSFAPLALTPEARGGILNNVFYYRSYNNYPFFSDLFSFLGIPGTSYFKIYFVIMIVLGFLFKKIDYRELLLVYLVCMVAFSSAIANQYLVMPMVMLACYDKKIFYWAYSFIGAVYFVLNRNEFHLADRFIHHFPEKTNLINQLSAEGGRSITVMSWILAVFLIFYYLDFRKSRSVTHRRT